jgi:tetratricopeptide (TPR) repeat protein/DNA-binding CsgD family transcriptional regulator
MVKHLFLLILTLFLVPQILLSNDDKTISEIDSLLELSKIYKFNVEIESAIEVAYLALDKSININYSEGKAAAYLNLAQTLFYLGSYEKSLEYLSFTEKEPYFANNIYTQFEISRIRGQIFTYLKLEKQSIREFQKCISIANQIESKSQRDYGLSMSYENLSVVYGRLDMPDSVFYFLSKNKDLLESIDESLAYRSMVNMYSSFGKWHAEKNEFELAEDYFAKTLQIAEKYQYPYLSQAYTFMGNMEMSRDNNDSALIYYNKALENLEITKIKGEYSLVYQSLSELYDKVGLTDSARIYREEQSLIENELSEQREKSVGKALEVFLNEEKRNQNIQKEQSEKIIIILVASILAFILLTLIISRKVHKSMLKKKENLKNELNESIKEVEQKKIEARVLEKKINESFNEVIELAKSSNPAFLKRFSEIYSKETEKILEKHPNLTNSELILCALIFLNFSTKDIAAYTFVEHRSVQTKKSRLRKKLNLPAGSSLEIYLHSFSKNQI